MRTIFFLLFTSLILSGCESFFDNIQPSDSLPADEAYTTLNGLQSGLNGAYSYLRRDRLGGRDLIVTPDLMSNNGVYQGGGFPGFDRSSREMAAFQIVSGDNWMANDVWADAYLTINQANLILRGLDQTEDPQLTENLDSLLRGEALFIRAMCHYELVLRYSMPYSPTAAQDPGVPLMLEPTATLAEISFPERASVEAVYQQVIRDMEAAANLLPAFNQPGRATRYAALAYLARIAFQKRAYPEAASLAQQVLEGPFSLTPEPKDYFLNDGSSEEILSLYILDQDPGFFLTPYFNPFFAGAMEISEDLRINGYQKIITEEQEQTLQNASLKAVDLRVEQLTFGDTTFVYKYQDAQTQADNAPILRLAEFYLMRAEALVYQNGVNQESIDLLNAIRQRAIRVVDSLGNSQAGQEDLISVQPSNFQSPEELIEAIVLERRVELCFEGNRFNDLMRLRRSIKGFPYDADNLRWPLPQRDVDANPNLVQNPGY